MNSELITAAALIGIAIQPDALLIVEWILFSEVPGVLYDGVGALRDIVKL